MGSEDTPPPGRKLETGPLTDKFNLAVMVSRLEAQIIVLKEQVDCLNDSDRRQDERLASLETNLGTMVTSQKDLLAKIQMAQTRSEQADQGHASRLLTIERRISGIGSVLVLIQGAFEIWKATHH